MSAWALGFAVAGLGLAFAPGAWLFVGQGLALFGVGLSVVAWRRRSPSASRRLIAAAGLSVALLAVLLSSGRVALTLATLSRLEGALR